jgi:hypothetical protein
MEAAVTGGDEGEAPSMGMCPRRTRLGWGRGVVMWGWMGQHGGGDLDGVRCGGGPAQCREGKRRYGRHRGVPRPPAADSLAGVRRPPARGKTVN